METLIVLGLLTGLDNLQVTPALGMMPMTTAKRWLFALTFGVCEALMPLAGLCIGHTLHRAFARFAETLGPVVMLGCGAAIIVMALREKDVSALVTSRWTLIGLPLSLSLDNLLAGLGVGATGHPLWLAAAVIGGISTAMCLLGLGVGKWIARWFPRNLEAVSGAYLCVLGLGMLWNPFGR
jgi:putative Mn2+ efflux pump MntP